MADPTLGGAPPLLVPRFELRVVALAPSSTTASSSSSSSPTAASSSSSSSSAAQGEGDDGKDSGKEAAADGQGTDIPGLGASVLLSAAVVESHPMDSDENCICMTLVQLEQGGSPRMYVAVGTGMNEPQGEDKAVSERMSVCMILLLLLLPVTGNVSIYMPNGSLYCIF